MSILIKGMDMPEHCYECLLRQGNCCLLLYEAIPPTVPLTRLDDCPLIEIPTPHGRLIDADLFKEIIKDSVPAWTIGVKIPTYGDMDIMDKIYFIPTILEAEE